MSMQTVCVAYLSMLFKCVVNATDCPASNVEVHLDAPYAMCIGIGHTILLFHCVSAVNETADIRWLCWPLHCKSVLQTCVRNRPNMHKSLWGAIANNIFFAD